MTIEKTIEPELPLGAIAAKMLSEVTPASRFVNEACAGVLEGEQYQRQRDFRKQLAQRHEYGPAWCPVSQRAQRDIEKLEVILRPPFGAFELEPRKNTSASLALRAENV